MSDSDDVIDPAAITRLQRIGGSRLVRELLEMYLQLGPERIAALRDGVAQGDSARVMRAAHSLKSTAGNVGAVHLQQSALEMERTAAEGTIDTALAARLESQYEQAVAALQRILEEQAP